MSKEGYITKEGGQVLSWKRRYMVLERDRMAYYSKDNKKTKKGEILLRTIKEVKKYKEYKARKHVFGIVTTTGRTYFIQCPDEADCNGWIDSVNEATGRPKGGQAPAPATTTTTTTPTTNQTTTTNTTQPTAQKSNTTTATTTNNNNNVEKKIGNDDFERIKVIGRGGFGKVLLVMKKDTGKVYAMKILKKADIAAAGEVEHTKTERNVLVKLQHPFLPRLHFSFQSEKRLYFIMDFINGGELFHHLQQCKRFPEERAKFYAAQIVSVLQYVHENGIIYRDLKPENLLLTSDGNIILTDFGLAKEGMNNANSLTSTFCGTPEYFAPEIIKSEDYTKAVDWWSAGTLFYEMLTGLPPFYTQNEEDMYHMIMTAQLEFPEYFSPEVADLISKLLDRDPNTRLQDPAHIRAHPWFKDIDWEKLESKQITPPFIPDVKSEADVANIDDEFLQADIEDSDVDDPDEDAAHFSQFTFDSTKQQQ
eukprot:TRINITY_DN4962_c0_g1_i1.p1 TRINITY_DN4962_c0_g1~~TRINITY_DN4962_c0_g1_i1.p1  ORF type:complete len:478 (-),score=153.15 TRINITY_DN4962_c0_g1_i1:239-1672(-)